MSDATRPIRYALGVLTLFTTSFVGVGLRGWGEPAANEQAIGEVSRWCERVSDGLLREPVNTFGNLAFVIAGMAMFVMLARDTRAGSPAHNRFIGNTPISILYASAAVFLGPGSIVMHGSHTRFGAWIDNVSMVAYILIPWLFNVAMLGRWRDRRFYSTYAALLIAYAAGYWFIGPDLGIGLDLFGVSIGLWVISEVLYRFDHPLVRPLSGLVGFAVAAAFGILPSDIVGSPSEYWWVVLFWVPALAARHPAPGRRTYAPWFWVGLGSFFSAYAIWLTGTPDHPLCRPDSLIQAHAIWHILCAVATFGFFMFLRTERSHLERQVAERAVDARY